MIHNNFIQKMTLTFQKIKKKSIVNYKKEKKNQQKKKDIYLNCKSSLFAVGKLTKTSMVE